MNRLIGGIKKHKSELTRVVSACLDEEARQFLDDLLEKVDSSTSCEDMQRYRLTLLKKTSQSTKVSKIRAATEDLRIIREMFAKVGPAAQSLDLSHEGVQYYAIPWPTRCVKRIERVDILPKIVEGPANRPLFRMYLYQ